MTRFVLSLAAAAASLAAAVQAATVVQCPKSDVCFSVGVPKSTTQSSGDIYFQITAPTSYSWVALASGGNMVGSNMFVVYTDGKGNVTLSNRYATSQVAPSVKTGSDASKLTLLEGSGVKDDKMTANVKCSDCQTWNGGSLNTQSTSSAWVAAWKSGESLDSTSVSEPISMHDAFAHLSLDLTKAELDKDENPFVTTSGAVTNGNPAATKGSGGSTSGSVTVSQTPNMQLLLAHGVIMSLVMVFLYPVGSALIPLIGNWIIHGSWQMVAYLLMWVGLGTGIKAAQERDMVLS